MLNGRLKWWVDIKLGRLCKDQNWWKRPSPGTVKLREGFVDSSSYLDNSKPWCPGAAWACSGCWGTSRMTSSRATPPWPSPSTRPPTSATRTATATGLWVGCTKMKSTEIYNNSTYLHTPYQLSTCSPGSCHCLYELVERCVCIIRPYPSEDEGSYRNRHRFMSF